MSGTFGAGIDWWFDICRAIIVFKAEVVDMTTAEPDYRWAWLPLSTTTANVAETSVNISTNNPCKESTDMEDLTSTNIQWFLVNVRLTESIQNKKDTILADGLRAGESENEQKQNSNYIHNAKRTFTVSRSCTCVILNQRNLWMKFLHWDCSLEGMSSLSA